MADELIGDSVQPNANPDSTDGGEGASQQSAKVGGSSWLQGFVSRFQHPDDREPVASGADSDDDAKGSDEDKGKDEKPDEQAKPFKVFATQEEYEAEARRLGQSEADRREAKRQSDEAAALRKQLRRDDPERFAALDEEAEAAKERDEQLATYTLQQAEGIVGIYDSAILMPILDLVEDEAKRNEIAGSVSSVETRAAAVKAVVDHLVDEAEKRGIDKGKKMARANGAVQKEVMRTIRAESDEPELVEAGASNGHKMTPNQWMRRSLGFRDD